MAIKRAKVKKTLKKAGKQNCDSQDVRSEQDFERDEAFQLFCVWMTLPRVWIGQDAKQLKQKGIDDEQLVMLLGIKTQKEFAKQFGVHENTMTAWKKKQHERNHLADARVWISRLTGNVIGNLYREASGVKVAPGTFKEYFRVVHELGERVEVTVPEELREALGKLDKFLPD